ncbi:PKD domain-containing protein [Baekduia soli]|uniref:PKD domain-containing protein n=1 Tax=Baekduia soli TaxID=496014 RepID=A0A5B8U9U9_9ACTN|nr:PKD domain-containing protein [Baekduia soli]QEC49787.1 PKD domain-containing protein [Baekduia soli]
MRRLRPVAIALALAATLAAAGAAQAADPVVMAAGDVACDSPGITTPGPCSQAYTAGLAVSQLQSAGGLDALLAMGDLQYDRGDLSDFQSYFGTTWGQPLLRPVLRPVPGNHEYETSGASGYFDYFASIEVAAGTRGQGWYSFDVGSWHFIGLNTSDGCTPVSCAAGSAQETWLRQDLATTSQPCIAAFWHHPLDTVNGRLHDVWQDLYDAGADLVLDGHNHGYTGAVALNADGQADPAGPRQIVVGTGGKSNGVYGLLKLTLHANGADWQFVGSGTSDSGSLTCHGSAPPPPPAPAAHFTVTANGLSAAVANTSTGSATSWDWDFGDGTAHATQRTPPAHVYAQPGTYTITLTAGNATGSTQEQRTVTVVRPPLASFTASVHDLDVTFTDTSTSAPVTWRWDFGDGASATTQSPSHRYAAAGTYTVRLTAGNAGGSSIRTQAVTVTAPVVVMPGGPPSGGPDVAPPPLVAPPVAPVEPPATPPAVDQPVLAQSTAPVPVPVLTGARARAALRAVLTRRLRGWRITGLTCSAKAGSRSASCRFTARRHGRIIRATGRLTASAGTGALRYRLSLRRGTSRHRSHWTGRATG